MVARASARALQMMQQAERTLVQHRRVEVALASARADVAQHARLAACGVERLAERSVGQHVSARLGEHVDAAARAQVDLGLELRSLVTRAAKSQRRHHVREVELHLDERQ